MSTTEENYALKTIYDNEQYSLKTHPLFFFGLDDFLLEGQM